MWPCAPVRSGRRTAAGTVLCAALVAGCVTVPARTTDTRRTLSAEFDPAQQDAEAVRADLRGRCDEGDVIDTAGPELLPGGQARVTATCLETRDRQGNRIDFDS
jgi:outer membrane murein-binding lipoprotein Lpp